MEPIPTTKSTQQVVEPGKGTEQGQINIKPGKGHGQKQKQQELVRRRRQTEMQTPKLRVHISKQKEFNAITTKIISKHNVQGNIVVHHGKSFFIIPINETWQPHVCRDCICRYNDDSNLAEINCEDETCPTKPDEYDYVDQEKEVCCLPWVKARCKATIEGVTKYFEPGQSWTDHKKHPCKRWRCEKQGDGSAIEVQLTGLCCAVDGVKYRPGQEIPNKKDCWESQCHYTDETKSEVYLFEKLKDCPEVNRTCKKGEPELADDGCCRKCKPPGKEQTCSTCKVSLVSEVPRETIGHFKIHDKSRGVCTNNEAILNLNQCGGACVSKSFYSHKLKGFDEDCTCCQPKRTSKLTVKLTCANGEPMTFDVDNPESCDCKPCPKDESKTRK